MINYSFNDALLLFNMIEGLGIRRKHRLLNLASPDMLINRIDEYGVDIIKITGKDILDKIKFLINSNALDKEKDKLYQEGVKIISFADNDYPQLLREIYEYPTILYCKGNTELLNTRCVSVVGSRGASRYGINVTRDFTAEFCRAGLTVVSGFARGIDSASHKMAVEMSGNTIAVLANGLDICYPAENLSLKEKILDNNGLFISEYRFGTIPSQFNFPERNRIISGLSEGLFVAEMKIKSGTMITVNHALEQGRTVYVVPSNINTPTGEGSNLLIKQMQGAIVLSPEDVLLDLGISIRPREEKTYQLSLVGRQIVDILEKGETHIEELIDATRLSVNEIQSVLFDLELGDLIEKLSGNYYALK